MVECQITKGERCHIQSTEDTRKLLSRYAKEVRSVIAKAREGLDVTEYTPLEKMTDNLEETARRQQQTINDIACDNCPFRR